MKRLYFKEKYSALILRFTIYKYLGFMIDIYDL